MLATHKWYNSTTKRQMHRLEVDSESDNNNNICAENSTALGPKLHVDVINLLQSEVKVGLWSEHRGWDYGKWSTPFWWGKFPLEPSREIPSGNSSFYNGLIPRIQKDSSKYVDETVISSSHQQQNCQNVILVDAESLLHYIQKKLKTNIESNQSYHDGSNEVL